MAVCLSSATPFHLSRGSLGWRLTNSTDTQSLFKLPSQETPLLPPNLLTTVESQESPTVILNSCIREGFQKRDKILKRSWVMVFERLYLMAEQRWQYWLFFSLFSHIPSPHFFAYWHSLDIFNILRLWISTQWIEHLHSLVLHYYVLQRLGSNSVTWL